MSHVIPKSNHMPKSSTLELKSTSKIANMSNSSKDKLKSSISKLELKSTTTSLKDKPKSYQSKPIIRPTSTRGQYVCHNCDNNHGQQVKYFAKVLVMLVLELAQTIRTWGLGKPTPKPITVILIKAKKGLKIYTHLSDRARPVIITK